MTVAVIFELTAPGRTQDYREAQAKGRAGIFSSYRLRVAQVLRDYTNEERAEAPKDSRKVHG